MHNLHFLLNFIGPILLHSLYLTKYCKHFCSSIYSFYSSYAGQMSRMFANRPEARGSIPGRVIPKTPKKKILDNLLA